LASLGFDVHVVPKVMVDGRGVSSTMIREAVELGDLVAAARMLGRPVSVFGRVVHGDGRGRGIGFPTANLDLHHELHPPPGVYACRARRVSRPGGAAEGLAAVANIGFRPTVAPEAPPEAVVEVHLLDFGADLYGERIELEFVSRLREERRFPGIAELSAQIRRDVERARTILGEAPAPPGVDASAGYGQTPRPSGG
jgi:riboflavin kinase/FMN adenylyltransferase